MRHISASKLETNSDKAGHLPEMAKEPFFKALGLLWIEELRPCFLKIKDNIDEYPPTPPDPRPDS